MRPRKGPRPPSREEQARKRLADHRQGRDDRDRAAREFQQRQDDAIAAYARAEAQRSARTYNDWRDETGRAGRAILDRLFRNR